VPHICLVWQMCVFCGLFVFNNVGPGALAGATPDLPKLLAAAAALGRRNVALACGGELAVLKAAVELP
jgi:hypothetical protein